MKKLFIAFILILLPLLLASCSGDGDMTTEPETHPPVEVTTAAPITLEEMSPSFMKPEISADIKTKVSEIDFSSMEEIEAVDSFLPDAGHDKIYKGDNVQYFFVEDDIKIHAIYCDDNGIITASASYNTETGSIEFYGDADFTWYFRDGELTHFVYTYSFANGSIAPIYTFYNPDGTKDVTRTAQGWYSPTLDLLTNEEIMEYLDKYNGTIEATASYNS